MDFNQFPQLFRATSPYIREHQNKRFVLLVPVSTLTPDQLKKLVRDLALLQVLEVKLTIVIELEPLVDNLSRHVDDLTQKLKSLFTQGLPSSRYRAREIPVLIKNVASLEEEDEEKQPSHRWYAASTTASTGNFATPKDNPVLIVRPIALDDGGHFYVVPANEVAISIAVESRADKLITFNEPSVISNEDPDICSDLSLEALESLLSSGAIDSESAPRFKVILDGCKQGVRRGHVVSYAQDGALLTELFTADGSGTQVSQDDYLTIREAHNEELDLILELMQEDIQEDQIIPRSKELLNHPSTTVFIAEHDNIPVGCVALYGLTEGLQEIGTLIAAGKHRDRNIGSRLLSRAERVAKQRNAKATYVFSKYAVNWFQNHDYKISDLTSLPKSCLQNYDTQRQSTLLIKELS